MNKNKVLIFEREVPRTEVIVVNDDVLLELADYFVYTGCAVSKDRRYTANTEVLYAKTE